MGILNWIRKNGNRVVAQRADAPDPRHFTALGNAIDPEWRGWWSPDATGSYETRRHVGQSAEGFHAGVEVCLRVYDRIVWSVAHATPEKAREAAGEMESRRREEIEVGRLSGNAPKLS
jgi:hypothetical protein